MTETLFFDAADTLIELREPVSQVYSRVAADHGLAVTKEAVDESLPTAFGSTPSPIYQNFPDGHSAERAWWEAMVKSTLHGASAEGADFSRSPEFTAYFDQLFDFYSKSEAWQLYPDTLPALQRGKDAGLTLAVVSNFDDRLFPIIDRLGLQPYFDLLHNSAQARCRKPDPAIFHQALTMLNTEAETAFHIGDVYKKDVAGAEAAGVRAFHLVRPELTLMDALDAAGVA